MSRTRPQARKKIADFVGTDESPEAFCDMVDQRYKVYRKWAFETLLEASERELWTRWMLPDWPADRIGPLAGELTFLYRQTMGHRHAQPDAKDGGRRADQAGLPAGDSEQHHHRA